MSAEKLHYEVAGPPGAPAVLLSAGLGGLGGYWRPQLPALAGFRTILYDQRGTGANPGAPNASIEAMADDVAAIVAAAGCGPVHFVGHALGGLAGLALALHHPATLRSLVVVNGWAALDSHTARCFAVRRQVLDAGGAAAYARAQPIFLYPAAWLSAHPDRIAAEEAHGVAHFQGRETLLARIAALCAFDVRDRLHAIATRTLVLAAQDDVLVPWTCSRTLASALPVATLALMPGGGHACNVTETDAFDRLLLPFLHG